MTAPATYRSTVNRCLACDEGVRVNVQSRVCLLLLAGLFSFGATGRDLPLIEAVKAKDPATVRSLLQRHVDVDGSEPDGTTALHWAVHHNDSDIVALLLEAGAGVTATNRYGVTPLALAGENGNRAIIDRLLNAGADPNTASADGETVLMTAARAGRADAVKSLLRHGADVSATEVQRQQTALMWAAHWNNADVSELLIRFGAKTDARSTGGFTPLLLAARAGHIETTRALLAAGRRPTTPFQTTDRVRWRWPSSTLTTSWLRSSSMRAPTQTSTFRGGPRYTRWPIRAAPTLV